ncbi:hypothetical protein N7519_006174 [Penicillium mononematosum]|uniref:uncharacterized protein n=1 Tax=Penicillium mononematosum TaxID=268346 RepID=UPI0025476483|nr:uncharacterized protein N7519_006174 [Penicillium mononematosum]KAJ6184873.1 hypothetical protein N7519_006174 [Penicillium mononematosum]
MASRADLTCHQATSSQIRPPFNPTRQQLNNLKIPIAELLSYHGKRHPHFPKTIAEYYMLDGMTLDDLLRFFHQTYPETTETTSERYPSTIRSWLRSNRPQWYLVDVETKRCLFGTFIGLTNELVDPNIHPLSYRLVHHNPAMNPENPNPASVEAPSGAEAVQRPEKRREKRKGLFKWFLPRK